MAEKKKLLMAEVQELNEKEDARFIAQILTIVRIHKQRQKEKTAERE